MDEYNERDWERLLQISEAFLNEWTREVEFNDDLQSDLSTIRQGYGFPLNDLNEAIEWLSDNPSRFTELSEITNRLVEKFQLNEDWGTSIFYLILIDEPLGRRIPMGLPGGRFRLVDGEIQHEFNISSDVDISNPVVQEFIKYRQLKDDPLPKPLPMKKNPKKLDWFPIWAWHKRHPDISLEELSSSLGYSYGYVRGKIAEISKEVNSK